MQRVEEADSQAQANDQSNRAGRGHQGEQADGQADHERVHDQYLPESIAAENFGRNELHSHGGRRGWHHQQARLPGGQAHADLVKKRKQEGKSADAQPGNEPAGDGHPERADPEKTKAKQRILRLTGMKDIGGQQCNGDQRHKGRRSRIDVMLAEYLQQPRQKRHAAAEQDQSHQVQRSRRLAAVIGHVAMNEIERRQAHRYVDEEYFPPRQPVHDQAADGRTEQRAKQCRDDDEVHRHQQLGFRVGPDDREPADGHHHCRPDALQRACGD